MISLKWLALRAVWRAPLVIEHEFAALLAPSLESAHKASRADAEATVRLSHILLGRVGRLRRLSVHHWRTTCLYRSVTECLVLRELGYPARVVIGARLDGDVVAAHAWVECEGVTVQSTRGAEQYEELSPASAASAVL